MVEYAIEKEEIGNDDNSSSLTSSLPTTNLLRLGLGALDGEQHNVTTEEVESALKWGSAQLKIKNKLDKANPQVSVGSPMHKHQQAIATGESVLKLAREGYIISKATHQLYSNHPELKTNRKKINVPHDTSWVNIGYCKDDPNIACHNRPYRTIDGSCNNLQHPQLWGTAMKPFRRILEPEYCDGVSSPRCGTNGTNLPSARLVSIKLHRPEYQNDPHFNIMFAVWGQFIDHDISATALSRGNNGEFLSCCGLKPEKMHPECFPVIIPKEDSHYYGQNITCMDFVRSAPAPTCTFRAREQLNQVSSYLDGSAVYGNTEELARTLRSYEGGRLRMYRTSDNRDLLPVSTDPKDGCNRINEIKRGRYCFLSGDGRANENIHLTTIHLIMARQHNFVADKLKSVNPHWNDDRLYKESRKIVSAQIQHITYNEFLEPLLGAHIMEEFDLRSYSNGYYKNYNNTVDATVSNVFAGAAFRFAHTLLPGLIKSIGKLPGTVEYTELHNILFNPFNLYNSGYLDSTLEGAMQTNVEKSNRFFNKEVTEHLFENDISTAEVNLKNKKKSCGLDLVSLNIQRGRDHGLPGYIHWRKVCNLQPVDSFEQLNEFIDKESIIVLSKLYKTVEDIDLYSGALSEYPIEGGILGPTATCIISDQFRRLKVSDRYWYENFQQPQSFSVDQLEEIRKTTLSKIICDNADNMTIVPQEVMKINSQNNKRINCNELSDINFSLWFDKNNNINNEQELDSSEQKDHVHPLVLQNTISSLHGSVAEIYGVNKEGNNSNFILPSDISPILNSSKNKSKTVIKSYFSATITGGNISVVRNGQLITLFDGNLPATLHLDEIIDPNSWGMSAKINWTSQVEGNKTIIGNFKIPIYVNNGSIVENNFMDGNFRFEFDYKWGGNADIIIPNKEYVCKILFNGKKKSTAFDGNTEGLKKLTVEEETCTIMMGGEFYERSFLCVFFPWWCSNENLFYWYGDIELILRKYVTESQSTLRNTLKADNELINEDFQFRHVYKGKVTSGWIKLNGNYYNLVPLKMQLPKQIKTIINGTDVYVNIFGKEIIWSCAYFHNSIYGTFSLPYYFNHINVLSYTGKFYFTIDPQSNLSLYKIIFPGMHYSTYMHFHDNQNNEIINTLESPRENWLQDLTWGSIAGKLVLVGNYTNDSKNFNWDGNFILILKKVPPSFYENL